jgi:hypothetical protein
MFIPKSRAAIRCGLMLAAAICIVLLKEEIVKIILTGTF